MASAVSCDEAVPAPLLELKSLRSVIVGVEGGVQVLMDAWATFCTSGAVAAKVLPLRKLHKRHTTA